MTDAERLVVEAMIQGGGSFVQQLGQCFLYADSNNFARLKAAFSDYWEAYTRVADKFARGRGADGPSDRT